MCGIAGFYDSKVTISSSEKENILNRMLTRIRYRGPDEAGLYLSPKHGMSNVRLSIVDLGSGQQPLCNTDRSLWIAYNGEVYNHIELKQQLIKKGHRFNTNCDTEVVLHMYEEYGADCLAQLNGQFAFSIWDEKSEQLFLARDRVGIRPLFYSSNRDNFVYASEVKCLFEHPEVDQRIDLKGLQQSLTFWAPLTPNTVFENIKEVPPGHYLIFDGKSIEVHSYWRHSFSQEKFSGTLDEAAEEMRSILKSSVDLRLRADVQVAAYLSGGIDSSVTTAFVNENNPTILNTFSIGFQNKNFDETYYQREVAKFFNTTHKSVTCSNEDIANLLVKAVYHAEAPLLRTSPIPMMKLSSLVRSNNIKVVLTGEGADEMLGGYNIFKETLIRYFWSKQPDSRLRPLLLKKLYPYIPQLKNASPAMLKMFFGYKLMDKDSPVYSHMLRWRNGMQLSKLLSADVKGILQHYDPIVEYANSIEEKVANYSALEKAQYIETDVFMSGYLLSSQGDRVAMANSVEGRYPFLDHRLIEFCSSLPEDFKINGLNEKYLLKQMMKNQLPDIVINRPKQAYRAPIASALINAKNGLIDDYLGDDAIKKTGLFDGRRVALLQNKIKTNKVVSEVDNMALVGLLSTQILHRHFIDDYTKVPLVDQIRGDVKNNQTVTR